MLYGIDLYLALAIVNQRLATNMSQLIMAEFEERMDNIYPGWRTKMSYSDQTTLRLAYFNTDMLRDYVRRYPNDINDRKRPKKWRGMNWTLYPMLVRFLDLCEEEP